MLRSFSRRARAVALISEALTLLLFVLELVTPPPVRGQATPAATGTLRVIGKVERSLVLHEGDLQGMPRKHLAVTDEKGTRVTYDGVSVVDILRLAETPLGKQLRGPQMKLYVIVNASDGYRVVFALPEFDPDFNDRIPLLADRRDGHPIAPPEGPFRLIVPGEKRHARWVREVTTFDVEVAK